VKALSQLLLKLRWSRAAFGGSILRDSLVESLEAKDHVLDVIADPA
jgi:hypothetical protein